MSDFETVIQKGPSFTTEEVRERAIVVGIDRLDPLWPVDESLAELERLANTAGAEVVAKVSQRLESPNPRTFIGSGKAEEIASLCRAHAADVVIFDDELSPSQQTNLEKIVPRNVKIIDRTALILDIFALHATSKEGRLQVRLAQNQYLLPRLRGMWAHLASNRMGGGVGSRFGEGESQLEVDRRMVRKRITSIKRELARLTEVRALQRESRYESGMYKVALAGYTNAGKSSLLNALTSADVLSYDKLFATLDSTTRKFELPEGREITLTDTVGFIQKLPTTLVEAFKSTLDEISGADLILHIIDGASEKCEAQILSVENTLEQIGAHEIPRINVINKSDLMSEEDIRDLSRRLPQAVIISAQQREGIDTLIERIAEAASCTDERIEVLIPYQRGDLVSTAHERCRIISESHEETGTRMTLRAPHAYAQLFMAYSVSAPRDI